VIIRQEQEQRERERERATYLGDVNELFYCSSAVLGGWERQNACGDPHGQAVDAIRKGADVAS